VSATEITAVCRSEIFSVDKPLLTSNAYWDFQHYIKSEVHTIMQYSTSIANGDNATRSTG